MKNITVDLWDQLKSSYRSIHAYLMAVGESTNDKSCSSICNTYSLL